MRILLVILICFISSPAMAGLMNFQQFKKLSTDQKIEIIKAYKEFVAAETSSELEEQTFSFNWKLIQEAYAASKYNCFYAGWPSTKVMSQGKALCSSPSRTNSDYQAQATECSRSEILCNPVLFGSGICVSTASRALRNSAFNQCEKKFVDAGNDLKSLANNLSANEHSSEAEGLFELVNDLCSKSSNAMCGKLKARVEKIKQAGEGNVSSLPNMTGTNSTLIVPEENETTETKATEPATEATKPTEIVAINPTTDASTTVIAEATPSLTNEPGDCSDVNLIKKENSPFEKIPVLDQSGTGMCYSYAAAQLVNYELIDSGKAQDQVVHPAWATVAYGRASHDEGIRGGVTALAVQAVTANNCNYDSAKEAIAAWSRLVGVSETRILAFIDDYGTSLRNDLLRGRANDMTTRRMAFERAANMNKGACSLATWMKLFDNVDEQAKNSMEVADRLLVTQCQSDKLSSLNLPPLQSLLRGEDQDVQDRMDDVLERGKPLSMSFCSMSIDQPGKNYPTKTIAQQAAPYNRREIQVDEKACGSHVALVVGRKKIGNSCHYLYRNSRGNKWFSENRHMTCVCKDNQGNVVENCKASTHARGYSVEACWVPASKLIPNVYGLDHY